MESPEELAPQVVAVIVTCDPGEWFEEELAAFAAQDYPELSVLVLDNGTADVTARVATVLPDAYVRRLAGNRGFGASANAVLEMVQGASYFLFCHDDVAPDPGAVGILVEESFRSNAGIVSPKLVSWADPRLLLHVGMAVDKGGAVVDRVEPGEVDHGQHDSVRDVFLAPGGCTLVRADLFTEMGGFDPQIFAMGEDLDLCWRAQVAGSRVVVAPSARVRHLELLASGARGLPEDVRRAVPRLILPPVPEGEAPEPPEAFRSTSGPTSSSGADARTLEGPGDAQAPPTVASSALAGESPSPSPVRRHAMIGGRRTRRGTEQVTLQSLQRRHELRAVLKDYGPVHRARVLPQLVVLSLAEIFIALSTGHADRAAAVVHAWRWNVTERSSLREARTSVRAYRRLSDASVRRLQLHGSARFTTFLRRVVAHGALAARLGRIDESDAVARAGEHADATEAERREVARATRTARTVVWTAAAVVVIFGTRELFTSGFPYAGQLLPFPSWSTFVHRFLSGWQPYGVGTTSSATPGMGILGLVGLLFFGGVGLLQKVVVLGCIPIGAIGMSRLMGSFGSVRARLASSIAYLAVPLPYDALATGRWDGLLVYAACPWIVGRLARAGAKDAENPQTDSTSPRGEDRQGRSARRDAQPQAFAVLPCGLPSGPQGARDTQRAPWRRSLAGRALGLGLIEALLTSLAPSGAFVTVAITAGLAIGTLLVGGRGSLRSSVRIVMVGVGATAVTVVLLAPWSVSVLSGPARWQEIFGIASLPKSGASWGSLLHLGVGPIGDTPLAWGFVIAAALPLLIGAGPRLAWAGRAWVVSVVAWLLAWTGGRGWLGALSVPPDVMLAPAAVGIAMAIGLGVAAFEEDLPGFRFGWRQALAVAATGVAAIGTLPTLAATLSGRWDVPSSGYGQATAWMAHRSPGDFRVLWLGDPAVLPGGGWQLSPGLAYALSENGLPYVTSLWPGSSPGPAASLATYVRLTETGRTVDLGQLLAPYAVRYLVLVSSLGPSTPGSQQTVQRSLPTDLLTGLASQIDLRQVIDESGFEVFVDDASLPERALHPAPASLSGHIIPVKAKSTIAVPSSGGAAGLSGWLPVLSGSPGSTHVTGHVEAGTLLDGVAPASAWELAIRGEPLERARLAFGYAASFDVNRSADVTLRFSGSWRHGLAVGAETALWVVVLGALGMRRRWFDRWLGPSSRAIGDLPRAQVQAGQARAVAVEAPEDKAPGPTIGGTR